MIPEAWGPIAWVFLLTAVLGFGAGQIAGGFLTEAGKALWRLADGIVHPEPTFVRDADVPSLQKFHDIARKLPEELRDIDFIEEQGRRARGHETAGWTYFKVNRRLVIGQRFCPDGVMRSYVLMWRPGKGPGSASERK